MSALTPTCAVFNFRDITGDSFSLCENDTSVMPSMGLWYSSVTRVPVGVPSDIISIFTMLLLQYRHERASTIWMQGRAFNILISEAHTLCSFAICLRNFHTAALIKVCLTQVHGAAIHF